MQHLKLLLVILLCFFSSAAHAGIVGGDNKCRDYSLELVVGGAVEGDNKADTATDWTTSDTTITYGNSTDDWNAVSLTPALLNSVDTGDFGVVFRTTVQVNGGLGNTIAYVDKMTVIVYYTEAGGSRKHTTLKAVVI